MAELTPKEAMAVNFMKSAARDAFRLCARSAEDLADSIEKDATPLDGASACRLLAAMFTTSANRD